VATVEIANGRLRLERSQDGGDAEEMAAGFVCPAFTN